MYRMWMMAALLGAACAANGAPMFQSEDIFTPVEKHAHGSGIIELPNGDFLASWFQGSGERTADDVLINGARLKKGKKAWGPVAVMADTPGVADCNSVLYLDKKERVWLFYMPVLGHAWEDALLKYRRADSYKGDGIPAWTWQDIIVLDPGEKFGDQIKERFKEVGLNTEMWAGYAPAYEDQLLAATKDLRKRQMGWMPRIRPLTLPSGRILLPLYSDGFNVSLVAISDDTGENWRASGPIVGYAPIQPALVMKKDGGIAAFLRDSGGAPNRIMRSDSADQGETWSAAKDIEIPNPGSSVDVVCLKNGAWVLVCNDTENGRHQLTALLSEDEGATWKYKRKIEPTGDPASFAYPSVMVSKDGMIHMSYSVHGNKDGKRANTIRHTVINEEWIKAEK